MHPLCLLIPLTLAALGAAADPPSQVHLSYNGNPNEMVVTWNTFDKVSGKASVVYGQDTASLSGEETAESHKWTSNMFGGSDRYTHTATMTALKPGEKYYYKVGSSSAWSTTYSFTALNATKAKFKACVFGDLGLPEAGGVSIPAINEAAIRGDCEIIFHIGDLAYDLDGNDGAKGDRFMTLIEPAASRVPYMVIAGNHEQKSDFQHYVHRFAMPDNGKTKDNQFWSFDLGDVHFVGLSSEYYGYDMIFQAHTQAEWLEHDLKKTSARWIVAFMHRPMYCSNDKPTHCNKPENLKTRDGAFGLPSLEKILHKHGVDLMFWGHEHTYERFYPIYNNTYTIMPDAAHFHNAPTTSYILSGAAGCHSHADISTTIRAPFSAALLGGYGYNVLSVSSSSLTSVFVDVHDGILDPFVLSKDQGYRPGQP